VKNSLKRKNSSDTIRESELLPRGATLDIGIPCIITSKRARFRAYARYIGEVEGELGPWVGVEVPVNDDWSDDQLQGRPWNDGTWGGIRYFDIGSPSEWEFGDATARRRRVDWSGGMSGSSYGSTLKREAGDQLSVDRVKRLRSVSPAVSDASNSESRGLFVRPQQVLYVVDAVA
jgi:dynactin complex subunit